MLPVRLRAPVTRARAVGKEAEEARRLTRLVGREDSPAGGSDPLGIDRVTMGLFGFQVSLMNVSTLIWTVIHTSGRAERSR
jgi:hypothetical protein